MNDMLFETPLPVYVHDGDYSVFENNKIYDFPIEEVENLVFESESYSVRSKKRDERRHFTTVMEAIINTYPVKLFISDFLQSISKILRQNDIKVYVTENGRDVKEEYVYHNPLADINYIDTSDFEDGLNFSIFAATLNLENGISGNVLFLIEGLNLKHMFSIPEIRNTLEGNLDELSLAGRRCGYNYVTSTLRDGRIVISYESKFKRENLFYPKFLYHVTPTSKVGKILKKGIVPKSESFSKAHGKINHPDRVYLFTKNDDEIFNNLVSDFDKPLKYFGKNGELLQTNSFTVLRIDTDKIKDLHLFCDNEYQNSDIRRPEAVYTYNTIPPYAISIERATL